MKILKAIIIPIISLALIVGILFYLNSNYHDLLKVTKLPLSTFFYFILIYSLHYYFISQAQTSPYKKLDINLPEREKFGLSIIGDFFNYFLPAKGGTLVRMVYLKKKYQLNCRSFLAMGFATVSSGYSALGLIGIIYIKYANLNNTLSSALNAIFIAMIFSGIFLVLFTTFVSRIFKFKRNLSPNIYLKDYKIVSRAIIFYLLYFSLTPIKLLLSFTTIGISLEPMQTLNMSLLLIIVSFFPVLPGNIGIKELATAYIAKEYGISTETALIASLIDRAISILFIIPTGIYFYWEYFLNKDLSKFNFKKLFTKEQIDY